MRKVLQVLDSPINFGGVSMFVLALLEHFDSDEMRVDCLTAYRCENGLFRQTLARRGGMLYELGLPLPPSASKNDLYRPAKHFFAEHDYDVIHIHSAGIMGLSVLTAATCRRKGVTVIAHSHGVGPRLTPLLRLLRVCGSIRMRAHVDCYCACSTEAAVWKFMPAFQRRTHIIHNGIDTERYRFDPEKRAELRRKLGIGELRRVVGNVGRLCAEKNQSFLLRAFAELAQHEPMTVLMLVGDGEDRAKLEALAWELGLNGRVLFIGTTAEMPAYLSAMDVFAFPSEFESFGIAAVEAQAAGLPVIASDRVPREVKMTESFHFLPLDTGAHSWAEALMCTESSTREDGVEAVRRAGYDISYTIAQLRKLYFDPAVRETGANGR